MCAFPGQAKHNGFRILKGKTLAENVPRFIGRPVRDDIMEIATERAAGDAPSGSARSDIAIIISIGTYYGYLGLR